MKEEKSNTFFMLLAVTILYVAQILRLFKAGPNPTVGLTISRGLLTDKYSPMFPLIPEIFL